MKNKCVNQQVWYQVIGHVGVQVKNREWMKVRDQVRDQIWIQVRLQVEDQVMYDILDEVYMNKRKNNEHR